MQISRRGQCMSQIPVYVCSADRINKNQRLLLKMELKLPFDVKISQEAKYEEIAPSFLADQFGKLNPSLGHNLRKYILTWFIPWTPPPVTQKRPLSFKHNSQNNFFVTVHRGAALIFIIMDWSSLSHVQNFIWCQHHLHS